jgi:hypothetical protein
MKFRKKGKGANQRLYLLYLLFRTFMSGLDKDGNHYLTLERIPLPIILEFGLLLMNVTEAAPMMKRSNWRGILEYFSTLPDK